MSVLRSSERKRLAGHYPFERFEERVLFLESLVRPGGLLVIHNSTYRFSDTTHRIAYEVIPVSARHDEGVFLPDGITEVEPDCCLPKARNLKLPLFWTIRCCSSMSQSGSGTQQWRCDSSRSSLYGSCLYRQKQAEQ
jgi:hypothetical protein